MTDDATTPQEALAEALLVTPEPFTIHRGVGTGTGTETYWGPPEQGSFTNEQRAAAILAALPPAHRQAWLDGLALAALRAAFRTRVVITHSLLVGAIEGYSGDVWEVMVSQPASAPIEDGLTVTGAIVRKMGATIAEAAAKAREALP